MGRPLGQHFLRHRGTARKIVEFARLSYPSPVLEIGPGRGILTQVLLQAGHTVIAVEMDGYLYRRLQRRLGEQQRFHLLHGDILRTDWREVLTGADGHLPCSIVSNLPYHISSPVLERMMDDEDLWDRAVLMLQREFAARLLAEPGGPDYSSLSVVVQARWKMVRGFDVRPDAFRPPPNVWSTVLRIEKPQERDPIVLQPDFRDLVYKCFRHRRKTLLNNVRRQRPDAVHAVETWLESRQLNRMVRPQELTTREWIELARRVHAAPIAVAQTTEA